MIAEEADGRDSPKRSVTSERFGSSIAGEPVATSQITASPEELTEQDRVVDQELMRRVENLPKEAGWVLVTAGVIGVIAPGVAGVPFLVAGAVVLTPGGPQLLSRWAGRKPRKFVHSALRQICRLVDDLERRYPRRPAARAGGPRVALGYRGQLDAR
jgi:hypothetical protein